MTLLPLRTLPRRMASSAGLLAWALGAMLCATALVGSGVLSPPSAQAGEAEIRKNLPERLPKFPAIDEVRTTGIPGVYEVRLGTDVIYTDEQGDHIIQGNLIDTRTRVNLTAERVNKLLAIDFDALPLKDAIVWKSGNGKRRMAVFADPNCGYCRQLERELQKLPNVTVYTFLYPILGGDSPDKSRHIWCAKDSTRTWLNWMLEGQVPPRSMGSGCTTPIERNLALGRRHKVSGTPAIVFADGSRAPGFLPVAELEERLQSISATR